VTEQEPIEVCPVLVILRVQVGGGVVKAEPEAAEKAPDPVVLQFTVPSTFALFWGVTVAVQIVG